MAADNRTEKATPKRRNQARKRGQVVRSTHPDGSIVFQKKQPATHDATAR